MAEPGTNCFLLQTNFFKTSNYPTIPEKKFDKNKWVEQVELGPNVKWHFLLFLKNVWRIYCRERRNTAFQKMRSLLPKSCSYEIFLPISSIQNIRVHFGAKIGPLIFSGGLVKLKISIFQQKWLFCGILDINLPFNRYISMLLLYL